MSTSQQLLTQAANALAPILGTVLVALVTWLGATVQRNIKNDTLRNLAGHVSDLAKDVVLDLQQTVVSGIRDASKDGVLTIDDAQQVKAAAIDNLKAHLGPKGKAEALKVFGFEDEQQLDAFIGTKIEAAVANMKSTVGQKLGAVLDATVEEKTK